MENKEIIKIFEKSNELLKSNIDALKDVEVSHVTGYYDVLEHCENEYNAVEQAATILRKIESGELVEVVHCCDCKNHTVPPKDSEGNIQFLLCGHPYQEIGDAPIVVDFTDYCSHGKRKDDEK